jgi:rare lipoprotein A (peptidoglycan hydrolase)
MHYRYNAIGYASWYGFEFHNNLTAIGMRYDCIKLSAAHRTLPLPCVVEITNLENGRSIKVLVNDRGPFYLIKERIIDVSLMVAKILGGYNKGVFRVQVRCLPEESRIAAMLRRRKPYPYYPGHKTNENYYKLPRKIPYIPLLNDKGSGAIACRRLKTETKASYSKARSSLQQSSSHIPKRENEIDKLLKEI